MLKIVYCLVVVVNNILLIHGGILSTDQEKDSGPFENGAELHAQMEEASAKAMAIIEGAAKFTEEVDHQNVEHPKPDEVRAKRDTAEETKIEENSKDVEIDAQKLPAADRVSVSLEQDKNVDQDSKVDEQAPKSDRVEEEQIEIESRNLGQPLSEAVKSAAFDNEEEIEEEDLDEVPANERVQAEPKLDYLELDAEEVNLDESDYFQMPNSEAATMETKRKEPAAIALSSTDGKNASTDSSEETANSTAPLKAGMKSDPNKSDDNADSKSKTDNPKVAVTDDPLTPEKIDQMIDLMNSLNTRFGKILVKWDDANKDGPKKESNPNSNTTVTLDYVDGDSDSGSEDTKTSTPAPKKEGSEKEENEETEYKATKDAKAPKDAKATKNAKATKGAKGSKDSKGAKTKKAGKKGKAKVKTGKKGKGSKGGKSKS